MAGQSPISSLTDHLLGLSPAGLEEATQHPFLAAAGKGELPAEGLAAWLTQDRLYGLIGYTKLMAGLLAKCPSFDVGPESPLARQTWSRLNVLGFAMSNVTREMAFFEDVAKRNGLPLDTRPPVQAADSAKAAGEPLLGLLAPTTRGYIDYMTSVALTGTFEEALVLVWAMEILYFKAWSFAKQVKQETSPAWDASRGPAASALTELIPNWTCDEFRGFVSDLSDLVNALDDDWRRPESGKLARLEAVWKACLWFETRFWDSGFQSDDRK
ncbi:unnamed protein product [Parajaminaea phylloscopi]